MINVAVGIIMKEGRVLLCQRKPEAHYPLKWEFPGGKVNNIETIEQCLHRELQEELGIDATIGTLYHRQSYVYPDSGVFDVYYYLVPTFSGEVINRVFETYSWVPIEELPTFDILEGNREVVGKLTTSYARFTPANS